MASEKVNIFGVEVDSLTMEGSVDRARELVKEGRTCQHVVLNAAKVVAMDEDPELARVVSSCDMINADGSSIVLASKVLGSPLPERVAGIELFDELVGAAAEDGHSVYFLGAQPHVVTAVAKHYSDLHPTLKVAGTHDGFWDDDEEVIAHIRAAKPDYLFLAIPSPRKEFWLSNNLEALGVPFVMGVGGSFDVVAGEVTRAPKILIAIGMEWSWRLIQEPRRMWKRYLVGNSKFLALLMREWRKKRKAKN